MVEQREGKGNRIVERTTDMLKRRKGKFDKEGVMKNKCEGCGAQSYDSSSLFTVTRYLFNFFPSQL